jgi:hypothetical protein
MAKIKLKFGENEIEIESRDFYVDNNTIGEVIESVTTHLEKNRAQIIYEEKPSGHNENNKPNISFLNNLDNAEFHEPEYNSPISIFEEEIEDKIHLLEKKSFFDQPRTAYETVSELREYGWAASSLLVSKVLTKMAHNKQILKNSKDNRSYYLIKEAFLTT